MMPTAMDTCRPASGRRAGFSLIELLVVVAVMAMLTAILLPAAGASRQRAMVASSVSNLQLHGQGSAMYAADNEGQLFTFSWLDPSPALYDVAGEDGPVSGIDSVEAAAWQATDILRRLTGRETGPDQIRHHRQILPFRRFSHLVLIDYLGLTLPQSFTASPLDRQLLEWQAEPLDESRWPTESVDDRRFVLTAYKQRWPYSSSYQVVPAAWSPDFGITVQPTSTTTNLMTTPNDTVFGGRRYDEVAFASQKVHMYEEFDFVSDPAGVYYAYEDAGSTTLMFDGSVRVGKTARSNVGWSPQRPDLIGFRSEYKPVTNLHPDALYPTKRSANLVYGWYRWTRMGLQGIDFGGDEVGLPTRARSIRKGW